MERGAGLIGQRQAPPLPADPITAAGIGILLRQKLPRWLQVPILGLDLYQWAAWQVIVLSGRRGGLDGVSDPEWIRPPIPARVRFDS